MGRQELLDYLLKEIEKCGFEIFAVDTFPIAAVVNVDNKIMVYNFKDASPFEVAHELIHILNKDNHRGEYFDAINPQEIRANMKRFFFSGRYLKLMAEVMNILMSLLIRQMHLLN